MILTAVATLNPSMEPFVKNLAMESLAWAGSQTGNPSITAQIKCRCGFPEHLHFAENYIP